MAKLDALKEICECGLTIKNGEYCRRCRRLVWLGTLFVLTTLGLAYILTAK